MTSFVRPLNEVIFDHVPAGRQSPIPSDLVSIIIASYNYADYVTETLDSVTGQTHPDIELVVVDDGSKDDSVRVIRDWMYDNADRFRRVVLARPDENQGLAQTRNSAIELSKGRKIFVLDSDNILVPTAIHRHAEVMERSGAQMVYSQLEWFGADKRVGLADFWDPDRFRNANYVDAMAMIDRFAWLQVGGYSYFDVMGWEDYDLWLKFIDQGFKGVFIPELLCRYRVHGTSMMHAETNPKAQRLMSEITARHPWLDLDPFGQ